jgi:hypothetical protein
MRLAILVYETIIFPVVLYRCESWSLILREQHNLEVFDNRVLQRMFELKREEMVGWEKLHNEEPHNLYSLIYIIRMIQV